MLTIDIGKNRHEYNGAPDHCPLCHHGMEAILIGSNFIARGASEGDVLQLIYRCPRTVCQRAFIGTYRQNKGYHGHYFEGAFILRNTAPYNAIVPDIPNEIKFISPNYVEVFSQSVAAETYQLDQIAGVGYRKSLEFLIKDYAIHKNAEKQKEIQNAFLGNCINDYVDDANVKACAKRATWLGNDEAHYIRKWEEKDVIRF